MLAGPNWLLEHFNGVNGRGNTAAGRAVARRAREEAPYLVWSCDACGAQEELEYGRRLYHVLKRSKKQRKKYGEELCDACIRPKASQAAIATRQTEEFREAARQRESWQSTAPPEEVQAWADKVHATRSETYANMTQEERSQGVRKQWETMSDEVKAARAEKISETSKAMWDNFTPEEREAHILKCIKGIPRSKVSNQFRAALKKAGLYDGFKSEVPISGFIADEADEDRKLVIEFYGDYYHCNPRLYEPDFYNTTLKMTAAQKWAYDRKRLGAFKSVTFRSLVVWEGEWKKDPSRVLEKVREFIERNSP